MNAMTIHVSINRDPTTVHEFLFNVENLPRWAKGLAPQPEGLPAPAVMPGASPMPGAGLLTIMTLLS